MNEICTACSLQMLFTGRQKQESYDVILLYLMNIDPASKRDTLKN
jgi:hypothetical protein